MLAKKLAIAGAVAVLGIGTAALIWSPHATRSYGVPSDDIDAHVFVRATAARDLVMGGIVLWAALAEERRTLENALAWCALAPVADFLLARKRSGNVWQLAIHASGVVGIGAVWVMVKAGI